MSWKLAVVWLVANLAISAASPNTHLFDDEEVASIMGFVPSGRSSRQSSTTVDESQGMLLQHSPDYDKNLARQNLDEYSPRDASTRNSPNFREVPTPEGMRQDSPGLGGKRVNRSRSYSAGTPIPVEQSGTSSLSICKMAGDADRSDTDDMDVSSSHADDTSGLLKRSFDQSAHHGPQLTVEPYVYDIESVHAYLSGQMATNAVLHAGQKLAVEPGIYGLESVYAYFSDQMTAEREDAVDAFSYSGPQLAVEPGIDGIMPFEACTYGCQLAKKSHATGPLVLPEELFELSMGSDECDVDVANDAISSEDGMSTPSSRDSQLRAARPVTGSCAIFDAFQELPDCLFASGAKDDNRLSRRMVVSRNRGHLEEMLDVVITMLSGADVPDDESIQSWLTRRLADAISVLSIDASAGEFYSLHLVQSVLDSLCKLAPHLLAVASKRHRFVDQLRRMRATLSTASLEELMRGMFSQRMARGEEQARHDAPASLAGHVEEDHFQQEEETRRMEMSATMRLLDVLETVSAYGAQSDGDAALSLVRLVHQLATNLAGLFQVPSTTASSIFKSAAPSVFDCAVKTNLAHLWDATGTADMSDEEREERFGQALNDNLLGLGLNPVDLTLLARAATSVDSMQLPCMTKLAIARKKMSPSVIDRDSFSSNEGCLSGPIASKQPANVLRLKSLQVYRKSCQQVLPMDSAMHLPRLSRSVPGVPGVLSLETTRDSAEEETNTGDRPSESPTKRRNTGAMSHVSPFSHSADSHSLDSLTRQSAGSSRSLSTVSLQSSEDENAQLARIDGEPVVTVARKTKRGRLGEIRRRRQQLETAMEEETLPMRRQVSLLDYIQTSSLPKLLNRLIKAKTGVDCLETLALLLRVVSEVLGGVEWVLRLLVLTIQYIRHVALTGAEMLAEMSVEAAGPVVAMEDGGDLLLRPKTAHRLLQQSLAFAVTRDPFHLGLQAALSQARKHATLLGQLLQDPQLAVLRMLFQSLRFNGRLRAALCADGDSSMRHSTLMAELNRMYGAMDTGLSQVFFDILLALIDAVRDDRTAIETLLDRFVDWIQPMLMAGLQDWQRATVNYVLTADDGEDVFRLFQAHPQAGSFIQFAFLA